ncbi:MAG TPA: nuclear transport factor 2 family protein [Microvirga sp.]|jgi:ketosteroid isomerase-like protein|nr:nuclear transport factor 2 family protein [Microvirga sp.]
MPSRERVEAFVAVVVSNAHVRAIADYYHEDASMQENGLEPRRGREVLMQHEARALARVQSVHTHPPRAVLVDGDRVAIHWIFDFLGKDGVTRRIEEVALQRWDGDRIREERFFYDTATAFSAVRPEGR